MTQDDLLGDVLQPYYENSYLVFFARIILYFFQQDEEVRRKNYSNNNRVESFLLHHLVVVLFSTSAAFYIFSCTTTTTVKCGNMAFSLGAKGMLRGEHSQHDRKREGRMGGMVSKGLTRSPTTLATGRCWYRRESSCQHCVCTKRNTRNTRLKIRYESCDVGKPNTFEPILQGTRASAEGRPNCLQDSCNVP